MPEIHFFCQLEDTLVFVFLIAKHGYADQLRPLNWTAVKPSKNPLHHLVSFIF
jgi:hypothetical protein